MANIKRKQPLKGQIRTVWTRLRPKEKAILERAFFHVQSVPYKVSLRWLFYRLYQEGYYSKDAYSRFALLLSRARHTLFQEWRPDTLEDETRRVISRTGGYENPEQATDGIVENILSAADIPIDHFYYQKNYLELWFEAKAMIGQFEYFTREIDLVPMGGTASIPFKWELAQRLNKKAERYGKNIVILYFGDEDESGHKIKETIELDVRSWTKTNFDLVWCGLTKDQVRKYKIPISIKGKGYQWESLSHEAAGEIIGAAVERYIDLALIDEVETEAMKFAQNWRERLEAIVNKLIER